MGSFCFSFPPCFLKNRGRSRRFVVVLIIIVIITRAHKTKGGWGIVGWILFFFFFRETCSFILFTFIDTIVQYEIKLIALGF